jgi:hypothetical protein
MPPPPCVKQYLLPRRRRLLLGAGVLFLLAGGRLGGTDILAARNLRAQNSVTRLEVQRLEAEAQSLLRKRPELAALVRVKTEDARRLLDEYARYRAECSPEITLHALEQLAALLDRHPGLHLEKLRWQAAEETRGLQVSCAPPAAPWNAAPPAPSLNLGAVCRLQWVDDASE